MPGTVLVKEVLWRASTLLMDTDPQFGRHAESDLVRFLDDAQMAITKFVPSAVSRIDTIRFPAGSHQTIESVAAADCKPSVGPNPTAALQGTLLLDVLCNMGTDGTTIGKAIRPARRDLLDRISPNWRSALDSQVDGYIYDPQTPRHLFFTPGLAAAAWVQLSWTVVPPKVVNTGTAGSPRYAIDGTATDAISVSDEHLDDLVNYIVARANMIDTEWADASKASAFATMFLNSINAKVQVTTGTNPNLRMLPFAPSPLPRAA